MVLKYLLNSKNKNNVLARGASLLCRLIFSKLSVVSFGDNVLLTFSRHVHTIDQTKKIMMGKVFFGISLICAYFCTLSWAQNAGDTLVLVDNLAIRETHSIFFKSLQGKKLPVNFVSACVYVYDKD